LGRWEGYRVGTIRRFETGQKGPTAQVWIELQAEPGRPLLTVYLLKDDLKHLWDYRYPKATRRFWKQWYNRAIRSRIEPLKRFTMKLKPYLDGIIAHCRWPLHTSVIEGINNKINVIKRMVYGFRDDEYFFLKIRAAFPRSPVMHPKEQPTLSRSRPLIDTLFRDSLGWIKIANRDT